MFKYVEFEGKSLEKALQSASENLKIPVDKLNYEVISYGSSGIFGLVGAKKAKIRAKVSQAPDAAPKIETIQQEARREARDLVKNTFSEENGLEGEGVQDEEDVDSEDSSTSVSEESLIKGKEVLQKIVDYISDGASIVIDRSDGRIVYKIEGGNSALLIGKRGQTLEALQYVIEKILNKQNDQRIRVLVDVEGYLETRKANLKKLASRMAETASRINKPVTIGQMNAYDRRIVHLHLKENQSVRTQSMGEGYYRKLVIFPKKRRRSDSQVN